MSEVNGDPVNEAITALSGLSAEAVDQQIELCESRLRMLRAVRQTIRKPAGVKVRKSKAKAGGAA